MFEMNVSQDRPVREPQFKRAKVGRKVGLLFVGNRQAMRQFCKTDHEFDRDKCWLHLWHTYIQFYVS